MTHRLPKFLLLFLLSLSLWGSSAQDAGTSWRIIVLDAGKLKAVTPEGITETWELPQLKLHQIAVSPTEASAIISEFEGNTYDEWAYADELLIYDLEAGVCCEAFVTQEMFSNIFGDNEGGFWIGGFNDNGSLFTVEYAYYEVWEEAYYAQEYRGLAVIDMATREIIATKESSESFGGWFGDEIVFYPRVSTPPGMSPEKYVEAALRSWDPFSDETAVTNYRVAALPYYDLHDVGEFIATGERITASFISEPDPFLPTPTIYPYVQYNIGSNSYPIWIDSSTVTDETIGRPNDRIARWISDGRYIYNRSGAYIEGRRGDNVQILSRTGEIQNLEVPSLDFFLTGTPDGWLAFSLTSKPTLIHYVYDGGILQREEVMIFERESIELLKKPLLGHSLSDPAPFPEVQPPRSLG